LPVLINNLI